MEALRRGRVYQELGCFWYEEPMPPWDHDGYAHLAASLDMRIATGENEYNRHASMDLLLKKGADVVQPDNRRAGLEPNTTYSCQPVLRRGSPTQRRSRRRSLLSPSTQSARHAIYMESGGKQHIVNGEVLAPEEPGMSSEPQRDFIAKHKIA